jgi:predicted RND superfamily exporter protein
MSASMSSLHRWAIRRPTLTMLVAAGLLLPAALGILHLEIRTDGRALAPEGAPAIAVDDEIRAAFGVEDPIVVVVETDDPRGVYNLRTLGLVRDLTERLRALPGAGEVSSLATEASDRVLPGSLRFRPFLDPFPADDAGVARVREGVHALDIYVGTLVGRDERSSAVYVGIPAGADRAALVRDVRRIADAAQGGPDHVVVLGAPVAEVLLGAHILSDLGLPPFLLGGTGGRWGGLVLVSALVMLLVFWGAFRSPLAGLPPLIEVGACILAVFGIMGWCGVPVYLTTAVLPVILVATGLADEVHVFSRCVQLARERPDLDDAGLVAAAFDDKLGAVVKTSVTTAIGFLSFTLSPVAAVRAFGAFAALGILLCLVWTLTVIPAVLVRFGPGRFLGRRRDVVSGGPGSSGGTGGLGRALERLARGAAARPWPVVAGAVLLAALSALGLGRVEVQDGWISGFAAASDFRRDTEAFETSYLGTHRLLVCIDVGHLALRGDLGPDDVGRDLVRLPADLVRDPAELVGCRLTLSPVDPPDRPTDLPEWTTVIDSAWRDGPGITVSVARGSGSPEMMRRYWSGSLLRYEVLSQALKRPAVLGVVRELEQFVARQTDCSVGGVLGPARFLETTNFMYLGGKEGSRSIPDDPFAVDRLWHNYGTVRGERRLRAVVDPTFSRALIEVYLKDANYVDTARLLGRIRGFEREHLVPLGAALSFSGDVATSQALIEAVVTTQVRSVLVSLVGIVLVVALLARSAAFGLLAVLPSSLAVLVDLAGMGLFGVPLGVATSMFAAMTLGIGVDYAIHLLEWVRRERARRGPVEAVAAAARVAGPAVLVDGAAVGLGFSVLALSGIPANARLGLLLVSSVGVCMAVTLVLLPAIICMPIWAQNTPDGLSS